MTEPTLREELRARIETWKRRAKLDGLPQTCRLQYADMALDIETLLDCHPDPPATDKRVAELEAQLEAARVALFDALLILRGIANAKYKEWQDGLNTLDSFHGWAKSVARREVVKAESALSTIPVPAWQEEARKLSDEWDKGYDCHVMMDPTAHMHALALRDLVDRYCKGGGA